MTRAHRSPCVVCGSTVRIEQNHLAARANDRDLKVPMCEPCHRVFTDWQWRLGVLRHETPAQRAAHDGLERAWALVQGFVLTLCLGPPGLDALPAVALGRAAGTMVRLVAEAVGDGPRWGPKPSMRRGTDEPFPEPRGAMGLVDLLQLGAAVAARLEPDEPGLVGIGANAEVIVAKLASVEQHGALADRPARDGMAARAVAIMTTIGAIGSIDELLTHGDELRELAVFADQFSGLLASLSGVKSSEDARAAFEAFTEVAP
jgi:hypothetical protein